MPPGCALAGWPVGWGIFRQGQSMSDRIPVLIGTTGMVEGEIFVLTSGVDLILGRSRSCDISLRRAQGYLKTPALVRDNDHDFNTVSRRHVRLQVSSGTLTVNDLSSNGCFVNGEQITGAHIVDLNEAKCTLRVGTRETFDVTLLPAEDPRVKDRQPIAPGQAPAGD